MKKLERLTLKELGNEMEVLDYQSKIGLRGGEGPNEDELLNSFYGNATIREICGLANSYLECSRDYIIGKLKDLGEDAINKAIEKASGAPSPFNLLQYMPRIPDEYLPDGSTPTKYIDSGIPRPQNTTYQDGLC